jgi:predicted RNA-binding Zn-ribbon protein involved in translation (DUF1610 family)
MGLMHEEFERCSSCGSAFFKKEIVYKIKKGSDYHDPSIYSKHTEYRCAKCGYIQYHKD